VSRDHEISNSLWDAILFIWERGPREGVTVRIAAPNDGAKASTTGRSVQPAQ
jgi:hypothetical protein